ncbi:Fic family protein [bacterium]|nr:Fic family protein [bacterium]
MERKNSQLGTWIQQPNGYQAFVPAPFPASVRQQWSTETMALHSRALQLVGKLDGITKLLPDRNLFLEMFVRKDAASSSQIEGTKATLNDAVEAMNIEPRKNLPTDVDDILHYIKALNYGLERTTQLPLSLRFLCETHQVLMSGARTTQFADPGAFRRSQNWIGGIRPDSALFVPPPVPEMHRCLHDWELYLHDPDDGLPLIKAGILHAQLETIHPFLDGNGRTGRLMVTFYLWQQGLMEMPVLYLSSYFRQWQSQYYEGLNNYHQGEVATWINFFLEATAQTALSAIETCEKIVALRERDRDKIQSLGKTAATTLTLVIKNLYRLPTVGIADIVAWTNYSKQGAYNLIEKLQTLGILYPLDATSEDAYGRKYYYRDYLEIFNQE